MSQLIIQHIQISWTKTSRGGRLAQLRNQIPKVFELIEPLATYDKQDHYFVHKIEFCESNEFKKPMQNTSLSPIVGEPYLFRNGMVESESGIFKIKSQWNEGQPPRRILTKTDNQFTEGKTFDITNDGWSQIEFNARLTDYDTGNWWYEHHIINSATAPSDSRNIFIESKPTTRFQELAHLW